MSNETTPIPVPEDELRQDGSGQYLDKDGVPVAGLEGSHRSLRGQAANAYT